MPTCSRRINSDVKFRESFRPFAPAVLAEHAHEYFDTAARPGKPLHAADGAGAASRNGYRRMSFAMPRVSTGSDIRIA